MNNNLYGTLIGSSLLVLARW